MVKLWLFEWYLLTEHTLTAMCHLKRFLLLLIFRFPIFDPRLQLLVLVSQFIHKLFVAIQHIAQFLPLTHQLVLQLNCDSVLAF